jgi:hypothetical protein
MSRLAAILGLVLVAVPGAAMHAAFAQSTPLPVQPADAGHDALLDAATVPLAEAFGSSATVDVQRLDRLGDWAFLLGTMRGVGGGPLPVEGTRYEVHAASGGMSDVYVALLKREPTVAATAGSGDTGTAEGHWVLLDHAIGPGDVAWLAWPERHAAPRALFGF